MDAEPRQLIARPTGIRADESTLLASALDAVQDLNERCLLLLQRRAQGLTPHGPAFLASLAPLIRRLSPTALEVIARQPFLLVDYAFRSRVLWDGLLADRAAPLRAAQARGTPYDASAVPLVRATLSIAHDVCRHHPGHAALLLGIDPVLCPRIAGLRLNERERLAERHPEHLRFRWENHSVVWRRLFKAAATQNPADLRQFCLYGLQLMAGNP
jgi:hypothetical protein